MVVKSSGDKKLRDRLTKLESIDLSKVNNVSELAKAMSKTAFGGRALGEAVDVTEAMVKDTKCLKVLTLSGAMTMAKMGLVICDMIDNGFVDVIVSTGALMAHGFVEAAGMTHYKDPQNISDKELHSQRMNRVYDTLEPEDNLDDAEEIINKILDGLDENETLCSYKINKYLGKYLSENYDARGVLKSAYEKNVPVFIPAFTDSEFGLDFGLYNKKRVQAGKKELDFNPFLDLEHYTKIISTSKKTGIFTIGGGVPRNWAQQVNPYLDIMKLRGFKEAKSRMFSYGVRICPEPVHWGGLSGCTYSEGVSWGKFLPRDEGGRYAEVYCDATIAWPIIVKALMERLGR